MKIALVAGAGFVGTRLAKVFDELGVAYTIFDKKLSGSQFVDITQPETLQLLLGFDVLINLAAEHRDDVRPKSLYDEVNVEGSRNLCQFCSKNGIEKIIFTSSVAVYGFAPFDTDENGAINYFNDYGRTKYLAEKVYKEWFNDDASKRTLIIIRPTVIFGEGNRGNVYNLLKQIASGQFMMFGCGQNKKSMAYVENVAQFLHFTLSMLPGSHLYNYIDKPDFDMNTLVSQIRSKLFDKQDVGFRLPSWLGYLIGYGFDFLAMITGKQLPVSSIRVKKFMGATVFSTAVGKTGFVPPVSLLDGLERTLQYEFIEDNSMKKTFYTE